MVLLFFKNGWEILKGDIINMFKDFHEGLLDIKWLNYGVITLVPKLKEANLLVECGLQVFY